jgi:hypothetical protein
VLLLKEDGGGFQKKKKESRAPSYSKKKRDVDPLDVAIDDVLYGIYTQSLFQPLTRPLDSCSGDILFSWPKERLGIFAALSSIRLHIL